MELTDAQMEVLIELLELLTEAKKASGGMPEAPANVDTSSEHKALRYPAIFFDEIRPLFAGGKLTHKQVAGIEKKLEVFVSTGNTVSHAAYKLATSFHETAQRMQPVREGLNASDNWRKKNLRYYPWYGRGDVQLTWETNYRKVDEEFGLGGALILNPDKALETELSAKVLDRGLEKGWFGPKPLSAYLPKPIGTKEQFEQARRTVNIMDKASLIAGYAEKFQSALLKGGYKGKVV